jgi:uncharacterized protein (TIGR02646 family)
MRKLRRPAVTPPTLTGPGKGGRQDAVNVRARTADPNAPLRFPDHWSKPDVRGALFAMHGRVCAYCQCGLPPNDPGDVEHFRPKSEYWWLAYQFKNYLLSCSRCNRNCKKADFPRPSGAGPWPWADRDRLGEEKILLFDPAGDQVEEMLRAERRHRIYFFMAPAGSLAPEDHERAETSIRHFNLNFAPLLKQRSEAVNSLLKALRPALAGDPKKIREVRRMAGHFQPHGATLRQILRKAAPGLIPTPEEDLEQLIDALLADLDASSAETPRSHAGQRFRNEILWALAVLWKDPPAGSPDLVESRLFRASCRDEVAAFLARL